MKHNFNIILVCILLLFPSVALKAQPGSTGKGIIFHSDFNALDGWDKDHGEVRRSTYISGELNIKVSDGKLLMGGIKSKYGIDKLMTYPINYDRDFSIEMSIAYTEPLSKDSQYGITFGTNFSHIPSNNFNIYPDNKAYMLFSTASSPITYHVDYKTTQIIKSNPNEFNIMRLEKIGNVVTTYINGLNVGSSSAVKFYGDEIGVYFKGDVALDYFTIAYIGDDATIAESVRLSKKDTTRPEDASVIANGVEENKPKIIFHSDFNAPDGWDKDQGEVQEWNRKSGDLDIRVSDGKLLMGGIETKVGINKMMSYPVDYARNFSIEMSIAATPKSLYDSNYGILFGSAPGGSPMNLFSISPNNQIYSLYSTATEKIKYHVETTTNEVVKNQPGDFNTLRLEKIGNVVTTYINGLRLGSSSTVQYYGDKIGVYFRGDVSLDYFTLTYLPAGATFSKSKRIESEDTTPPEIAISSPIVSRGLKVVQATGNLTIMGTATDASGIASVTINGIETPVDGEGNFSSSTTLKPGDNSFVVVAKDKANNSASFNFAIVRSQGVAAIKPAIVPVTIAQSAAQGKYYALVIGIQDYKDPTINDLDQPVADAASLANVLAAKYTFDKENITLLKNPGRSDMFRALENLSRRVGPEDNLLIFYAGHGYWDAARKQGYWFPSDAGRTDRSSWLTNADLKEYISSIPSKHTLLITDACFAGSIFKSRAISTSAPRAIRELYDLPSRKAMTSGTLKEVPDKSVFIEYLVKRLNQNANTYLSAEKLYSSFRDAVINNSANGQVPQYGEIREAGDEGGDFIFIKRQP